MYNINFCRHVRKRFVNDLKRVQREIRADKDKKWKGEAPKGLVEEVKDITL